jgi:hypothetical protein
MKETRKEMLARLRKVEAEYQKVRMGIESEPEGNGFATQEEMRKAASELYGSTIFSLRRKLGIV